MPYYVNSTILFPCLNNFWTCIRIPYLNSLFKEGISPTWVYRFAVNSIKKKHVLLEHDLDVFYV